MSEQESMNEIIIPQNVTQQRRIMGFRMRNIIEAGVMAGITAFLIHFIPFTTKVGIIFTVFTAGSIGILNLMGIKGMSITETIINIIISSKTKYKYHLKSIKDTRKKKDEFKTVNTNTVLNESLAEKGFRLAKEAIKKYVTK